MSRRGVELLFATWIFPEQGQQFKSDTPGATGHELVLPTQQRHLSPLGIQGCPLPTHTLAAIPPTAPCAVSFSARDFSAKHCKLN